MPSLGKWASTLQEPTVATEDLLGAVPGDLLKDGVHVNDGVVGLEGVGDDEAAGGGNLYQVLDGEGDRAAVVEHEPRLLLVPAQIRIAAAAVPLHLSG